MKKLYLPQGIKEEKEIFSGYAMNDLGKSFLITAIGFVIAVFIYLYNKNNLIICSVVVLGFAIGSVGLFTKTNNISMFDCIVNILKYFKSQKYYPYRYLDEWNYGGDQPESDN